MSDAKRVHDWNQTSTLWSLIANVNRNDKETPQPYTAGMVHPYVEGPDIPSLDDLPEDAGW